MNKQILIFWSVLFAVVLCIHSPSYAEYYADQWKVKSIDDFEDWVLGVGVVYATSPYEGVDGGVSALPLIFGRYERFYIDGTSAGFIVKEFEDPNLDLSFVLKPRIMGYDSDDSDTLDGMQDRDWSLDGGLRTRWNNQYFRLMMTGLADLTGKHEGYEFNTYVSKAFFNGLITPKFGIKWQSKDLVDYYYGVPASEATARRPEYIGGSAVNIVAGVLASIPVNDDWTAGASFQYEHLGSDIEDSPIVNEDGIFAYVGGVVYRF